MKAFILTEGGSRFGFGHVVRSLSLYQAFEEKGIYADLIVNGDDSIAGLLRAARHEFFNWIDDRDSLFDKIKDAAVVIVDSYYADASFYRKISELVRVGVYMDDSNRLSYPKGLVVNGNIYAKSLDYPENNGTRYLLGTEYAPLRKAFWNTSKTIKQNIGWVMVTFGGEDSKNLTPGVLKFLRENYPSLKKNAVITGAFKNVDQIKKESDKNTNLIYCPDAEEMKKIMLQSDLVISSGGQTLYELARVGVPAIGICLFDNQERNLENWHRREFVDFVGWYDDRELLNKINRGIEKLRPYSERKRRSSIGRAIVDGQGVWRVVNTLTKEVKVFG